MKRFSEGFTCKEYTQNGVPLETFSNVTMTAALIDFPRRHVWTFSAFDRVFFLFFYFRLD